MKLSSTLTSQLILFSNTKHITKKVTEEISQKNLKSFLKTALFHEHYPITKNTKIFYSYIEKSHIYEIYCFESSTKNPILEFQLLEKLSLANQNDGYNLFVCESFFTIFYQNIFLFAYQNKNYSPDEILKFILFTHKIEISNPIFVSNKEFEKLKEQNNDLKQLPFVTLENQREGYYFIIFLLFLIIGAFYFYYFWIANPNNKVQPQQVSNAHIAPTLKSHTKIIPQFIDFIQLLDTYQIKIEKLEYNTKLIATLKGKTQNLHTFIETYPKDIKITKIDKKNSEMLTAEIEVEFK